MWGEKIQEIAKKKTVRVAGLISGTSADGIDVALCDFNLTDGEYHSYTPLGFHTERYDPELKKMIGAPHSLSVRDVAELDIKIGKSFADALSAVAKRSKVALDSIDLIGSHGQTIYHHSSTPNAQRATLQLGCADTIAVETGIPVVFDFRRKDIIVGGEGAPLTPFSDFYLYRSQTAKRAILNLGGIGNITVLADTVEAVRGFDTGPANAPLDRLVALYTNGKEHYDVDGKIALSGTVSPKLLKELLAADSYVKQAPPKSTGFEMYGDSFVRFAVGLNGGQVNAELIATMTEYVAQTVAISIKQFVSVQLTELILAGGGAHNGALRKAIERAVHPIAVKRSDEIGIQGDAREAIGFALFGLFAVLGKTSSIPGVTGAKQGMCLGKIAFP